MKNLKCCLIIAVLLLSVYRLAAQKKPVINVFNPPLKKGVPNLKVGDTVPDFKLEKIFNDKIRTANVSDYRDRLLILDFGYIGCAGCVHALPKLEVLQKQFKDQIKIFWVIPQYEEQIKAFWPTTTLTRNNTLPTVVEDSTAAAYFRHRASPHEAWIYKGKVVAITGAEYVTAENISKVLSGAILNLPVKDDYYAFDGRKEMLFKPDSREIKTGSAIYYANIGGYRPGLSSSALEGMGPAIDRNTANKTLRFYFINKPVDVIYQLAWAKIINRNSLVKPQMGPDPTANGTVWEVADRSKYSYNESYGLREDWLSKNGLCFESVRPDTGQTDVQVYQRVIADLDSLLGLHVRWEKRKEKVLVLERTGEEDKLKSKKSIEFTNYNEEDFYSRKGNLIKIRDSGLPIASRMNAEPGNPYVFDETGYKGMVDMDLNIPSWTDIPAIRKAIAPYGLDLKEEERVVDKLVFKQLKGDLTVDRLMQIKAQARRSAQKGMAEPTLSENSAFMALNKKNPGVMVLPSGLQYRILREGTGTRPDSTDRVLVNYIGMLTNGKIFDSSYERGIGTEFKIADVIKGWQEALHLMRVGSKWVIYVPSELGYGTHTGYGTFPPNSNLIFEVELLSVIK